MTSVASSTKLARSAPVLVYQLSVSLLFSSVKFCKIRRRVMDRQMMDLLDDGSELRVRWIADGPSRETSKESFQLRTDLSWKIAASHVAQVVGLRVIAQSQHDHNTMQA